MIGSEFEDPQLRVPATTAPEADFIIIEGAARGKSPQIAHRVVRPAKAPS